MYIKNTYIENMVFSENPLSLTNKNNFGNGIRKKECFILFSSKIIEEKLEEAKEKK